MSSSRADVTPRSAADDFDKLRPHADLAHFYGDQSERLLFVRSLFDDTAVDYDRINAVMALGSGVRYRRDALRRAGLRADMRFLDVATGTGLLSRAARAAGVPAANITALDPSAGMLAHHSGRTQHALVRASADALPFAEATFDFVAMGYALRHVDDLLATLRAYHRTLVPGGRLLLLEITHPKTRLGRKLAHLYFGRLIPRLATLRAKSPRARELMTYYWATIEACIPPALILDALTTAGFTSVKRHTTLGIFSEYQAQRSGTS